MKYQRKTKKWYPLFSNFKFNLFIALIATIIAFVASIVDWKETRDEINVRSYLEKNIIKDSSNNYNIISATRIELKNLNFFQTKMLQSSNNYFDTVNLLFYLIVISTALFFTYKYSINNIFHNQFSSILKWAGIIVLFFLTIDYIRNWYTTTLIIKQTQKLYFFNDNIYLIWFDLRFFLGVFLLWLHKAFKKGEKLQIEADLTV